ncbi:MAG: coproporphyrinogen dehydrogenase HemZ [Oscillospiraceae bacterium]
MKLVFHGHEERYAVEQSLLNFFPGERPVYEGDGEESEAEVTLRCSDSAARAETCIRWRGKEGLGKARVSLQDAADEFARERERQKAVKLSFFRAAREVTGTTPPWGALTGIRPGKLAERFLKQGKTPQEVSRILADPYCVTAPRRRLAIESAQAGIDAQREIGPKDISLYLGIPFCPTRCAYCSFVSNSVEKSFALIEPYLQALYREIDAAAEMVEELGLTVRTFYMGGGTPTTLTAEQMEGLLSRLRARFDFSRCREFTVEAGRPDTITRDKLRALKRGGVDRVSVNPQTMEDHVLAAIGRRHSSEEVERAMELVHEAGFAHVNMDLIAGLPEDTPAGFRRSLQRVLCMGADNITVHTLSLKKGSRILLEGSRIPEAEEVGEMLDYADPILRKAGFRPYYLYRQKYMSGSFENVGWCREGAESLYNIYIMEELMTILSLGAGGSTKMVDQAAERIERVFNLKYPKEYIDRPEKVAENHAAFRRFYEGLAAHKDS